jgi:SAM-dependent methyltransferase
MIHAIAKVHRAYLLARKLGIRQFAQELGYRAANYYHERRLGVTTDTTVTLLDLGIDNAEQHDHMAMGYPHIWAALRAIPVEPPLCTFMDFGCGMGRAIIAAATLPYREIIGIDVSDQLLSLARKNVDAMRGRKAGHIQLAVADAARYDIPDSVNLMYFYNPFHGEVLHRVVENIRRSFNRVPRPIHIVFFNNGHFEKVVEHQTWLRKVWQKQFYPHYSCGAYLAEVSRPV